MRRTLLTAAICGGFALLGGLAWAQSSGHMDHGAMPGHAAMPDHAAMAGHGMAGDDPRELVAFPAPLAAHTLTNMRDHLVALQEITAALGRGETAAAAKIAETRLGMSSLELHNAHEAAQFMPPGMQAAGSEMHRAASRFALEAQNAGVTGDLKPALGALAAVMEACATCHAGYRLK